MEAQPSGRSLGRGGMSQASEILLCRRKTLLNFNTPPRSRLAVTESLGQAEVNTSMMLMSSSRHGWRPGAGGDKLTIENAQHVGTPSTLSHSNCQQLRARRFRRIPNSVYINATEGSGRRPSLRPPFFEAAQCRFKRFV